MNDATTVWLCSVVYMSMHMGVYYVCVYILVLGTCNS